MSKFPTIPSDRPSLPAAFQGQIYEQVGKYARQVVLYAFEEIGGADSLANWAKTNETEFYTKLFPKIIAKESEVKVTRGVDELMDVIDGVYEVEDAEMAPDVQIADDRQSPDMLPEYDPDDVEFER